MRSGLYEDAFWTTLPESVTFRLFDRMIGAGALMTAGHGDAPTMTLPESVTPSAQEISTSPK